MATLAAALRQKSMNWAAGGHILMLIAAALLLAVATQLPWWGMLLYAPQYPQGLEITAYLNEMVGDVAELDTLNHYVGMMSLSEAAKIERALVVYAVPIIALLAVLSAFAADRWRTIMRLPIMLMPAFFIADLTFWLWYAGNNLNPAAPLSQTISSFTPTALGAGKIAQFVTYGYLLPGFWVAVAAAVCALMAGLLAKDRLHLPSFGKEVA